MSAAAAASIAWNGIVVEVLNRENYLDWSALVENYLKGNNLWYNIIEDKDKQQQQQKSRKENENDSSEWESKDRRALHAIQLSCGKALGQIRNFKTAREAWNHLKTSFSEDVKAHHVMGQTRLFTTEDPRPLQVNVKKGFLEEAKLNINVAPRDIFSASREDGRTALHDAVAAGHADLVKDLAKTGKQRLIRMQDKKGFTALALAAMLTDNKEMAECMVMYGGEELLTIAAKAENDDERVDEIPVLMASAKGHKEMTRYLFNLTPWPLFSRNNWEYGVVLLSRCIYNEIFDVAVAILQDPHARELPLGHSNKELRPIYALAHMPDAFPSTGTNRNWLKQFIYHNMLSLENISNGRIEILIHAPDEIQRPHILTHTVPGLGRLLRQFHKFVQTSILLKFSAVFQKIYDEKMNHYLVLETLKCLSKRISEFSDEHLSDTSAHDAMLQAAKNGITEFIESMTAANAELLLAMDESNRGIFAHAILNRQEKVFQLIHHIENREIFTASEDTLGNNLLHIAAELGPPRSLDPISNAALQMQRELQWFQEVKDVMPRWCHAAKDANGKTPSELFTHDHDVLLRSAQEWAKETAKSFTLVGTLIITIMFAAAFTVPGGLNDKKGTPFFLGNDIFFFFIVSVAVSLVASSSSVLMFIGILTSRYAEKDFIVNLPLKLLFGLVTMFFSVAFMMCAFCAALALMLEGYYRIVIAAMWLALLPILVSVPFLLRLTLDIFHSTVRFFKIAAMKKTEE